LNLYGKILEFFYILSFGSDILGESKDKYLIIFLLNEWFSLFWLLGRDNDTFVDDLLEDNCWFA
jgi:hypothetical protein